MKTFNTMAMALAAAGLLVTFTAGASQAAGRFAVNHPRRAQVLGRDRSLNRQLWSDRGHLGGNFGSLQKQDLSIRQQEQADARANGGYITRAQRLQFNGEEKGLQSQMNHDYRNASTPGSFAYNHPRRSQILSQDRGLNQQLNSDKGNLDGNYGRLKAEDGMIGAQEQRDARINGGFITQGQEQRLSNEESHLQNQINNDLNK
ncbi:MAG TPA: hypothetical protein V6D22_13430 [Candidatus Obscuribacterales bacterium]